MNRIYAGVFVLLIILAVVIAPITYRATQKMFAGQNPVFDNINHSAHHQNAAQYLGGGK